MSERQDRVPENTADAAPDPENVAAGGGEGTVPEGEAGTVTAAEPEAGTNEVVGESPVPRVAELEEQLQEMRAAVLEQEDRFLRAKAEVENIRRRADNDIANARKFSIDQFAAEILNVRDSLELARAVELKESDHEALQRMQEGLDLTLKQVDSAFSKFAIEVIDPQPGDKLDPQRHQALSMQESADVQPNHVIAVIQKGYALHERLLRPATVIVAKAREEKEEQPEQSLN